MKIRKQEIVVSEKALEPVIPVGATVICTDGIMPKNGDFVVYFPGNQLPIFRKWRKMKDQTVLLESLSPEADSYRSTEEELLLRGKILVVLSMNRIFRELPEQESEDLPDPEDFLTFQEAMTLLKVKRTRMYGLLQSGELRAVKLGRLWRIERASLSEFLKKGSAKN